MDFSQYKFSPTVLPKIMSNSKAVLSDSGSRDLVKIETKQIKGIPLSDEEEKKLKRLLIQRENSAKGGIILSEGCKNFLCGIYLEEVYGKRYRLLKPETGIGVPQMVRGVKTEKNGLALLCEVDGKKYYKYKKTVENQYITGKLDIIDAPELKDAKKILDIKSAKDEISFFNKMDDPFTDANIMQMQAYFGITGISEGEIVHCLVGEPDDVIEEQRQLLFDKMCPDGVQTESFLSSWSAAKKSMLYEDIPAKSRLIGFKVYRDDDFIELIYETVRECRKWLNEYHTEHKKFISRRYFE